jgi:peptide/nickel transport system ATP-binding protein
MTDQKCNSVHLLREASPYIHKHRGKTFVVAFPGEVVEQAPVDRLFHEPLHPYTQALLKSVPRLGYGRQQRLNPIRGSIPDPFSRPTGCPFHDRCEKRIAGQCEVIHPRLTQLPDGRTVRCLLYENGEES